MTNLTIILTISAALAGCTIRVELDTVKPATAEAPKSLLNVPAVQIPAAAGLERAP